MASPTCYCLSTHERNEWSIISSPYFVEYVMDSVNLACTVSRYYRGNRLSSQWIHNSIKKSLDCWSTTGLIQGMNITPKIKVDSKTFLSRIQRTSSSSLFAFVVFVVFTCRNEEERRSTQTGLTGLDRSFWLRKLYHRQVNRSSLYSLTFLGSVKHQIPEWILTLRNKIDHFKLK